MAQRYDAIALGSSVALTSLGPIATLLQPYNRLSATSAVKPVGISSEPITLFPNVETTLDHYETSQGPINTTLTLVLYALAYQRLGALWFTNGTVKSVAVTLYTYVDQRNAYARFNCISHYPDGQDIEQLRGQLMRVHWRFADLEEL